MAFQNFCIQIWNSPFSFTLIMVTLTITVM